MSELQIGLLVIGVLVVVGVLAYNRIQERRRAGARPSRRSAPATPTCCSTSAPRASGAAGQSRERRTAPRSCRIRRGRRGCRPDAAIDYVVEFSSRAACGAGRACRSNGRAIERRHARRAPCWRPCAGWQVAGAPALQLVSRDGAIGEADLIEFRSAVETLAALGRRDGGGAGDARRGRGGARAGRSLRRGRHPGGAERRRAARSPAPRCATRREAAGLTLEADGRFALRDGEQRLLYTLAERDGTPFAATTAARRGAAALTLALDVARTPETRRSFEPWRASRTSLSSALGGTLVDDNGNALDERAAGGDRRSSSTRCARAWRRSGIAPGSPAALRLFS